MRKLLAVAAMLTLMVGAASAQGGGGGGMGRGRGTPEQQDSVQFARLFNGITLSDAVAAKAKEIIKATREANAALDRTNMEDFMAKMQAANAKRNADLKALLTSDADKAKFDENAAAMGRGRRGGGH